ncbi:ribbon-helix-helix domain-containing protein [Phenylobacterium sp.]|uniref:ribbon-helix-helix domain-containing protein n=1 Tax=Phenylobacterium sp. TaxID=1871053 RepID=UPI002737DBC3|nr:ribbon-helix-helix domain-containing protein [Phenylobacterium sp.]MDP3869203.1 ribbon-helix-helix domain-containing protein [Phenylobacterium sp.]
MGRPALNVKPVTVNLPADMPARIDAVVGSQKRSEFIREAVEGALHMAHIALKAQAKDE